MNMTENDLVEEIGLLEFQTEKLEGLFVTRKMRHAESGSVIERMKLVTTLLRQRLTGKMSRMEIDIAASIVESAEGEVDSKKKSFGEKERPY